MADLPPQRPTPQADNIVLVGFMATGKSTLGRLAARHADYEFLDSDHEIEKFVGKKIPHIFAEDGENTFRDHETQALLRLHGTQRTVIATGGGMITRPENLPHLQRLGFVVWLHTREDLILKRIQRKSHRPLVQTDDQKGTIRSLLEKRLPLYRAVADIELDTSQLTREEAVVGILESASWFFSQYRNPPSSVPEDSD